LNNDDPKKNMILISAPTGTSLEVKQEENEHLLKMDSNGIGEIKVYTCNRKEGVKRLEL
jgi:hypothetical protein